MILAHAIGLVFVAWLALRLIAAVRKSRSSGFTDPPPDTETGPDIVSAGTIPFVIGIRLGQRPHGPMCYCCGEGGDVRGTSLVVGEDGHSYCGFCHELHVAAGAGDL